MDWIHRLYWKRGRWAVFLWIERPAAKLRNRPIWLPYGMYIAFGGLQNGRGAYVFDMGGAHWAGYPIDWIRTPNGGYPLSGSPYELGEYPAGGGILQIEYAPLMGGCPMVSSGRHGLGCVFGLRGGFA